VAVCDKCHHLGPCAYIYVPESKAEVVVCDLCLTMATGKAVELASRRQDYYAALIVERGDREAASLLADECRKKDAIIERLKDAKIMENNLRALAVRLAAAFRKYDKAKLDFRDLLRNWEAHRERHEKEGVPAPWKSQATLSKKLLEAQKAFWIAARELDKAVPDEEVARIETTSSQEEVGS